MKGGRAVIADADLSTYSLFGGLNQHELDHLRSLMQREIFPSDYDILREGETGDRVYFILEGLAEVRVKPDADSPPERVATLEPGQIFGEMEILDIQPRTATVRSLEETTVLVLTSRSLYELKRWHLEAFTLVMMNLARDVSRRLRLMDRLYLLERQRNRQAGLSARSGPQAVPVG